MPNSTFVRLLVTVGMVALGGCKFLGSQHLVSNPASEAVPTEIAQREYGPAIQRGRIYLQNNMVGLAIDSFNVALASGEDPAAAYNGLGVAYSRLGRADLGYRFFKKAVMSDPANPAYARNLVRVVNSPEFTLNLLQRTPLPEPTQTGAQTAVVAQQAERVPGRLYRERDHQFSLVTLTPREESRGAGLQYAAANECARHAGRAARRGCEPIRLPKIESRAIRSPSVALTEAATLSQANATTENSSPSSPAKGKAKMIDLTGPGQTGDATQKPKPARAAAAASAT